MRFAAVLKPKQPRHLKATAAACAVVLVIYLVGLRLVPWNPKRGPGLLFGFLAALLFVFEMLYASRRPRARPMGTARAWLQAHVYVGLVAMLATLIHSDFRWPSGGVGWWLLLLSAWTTMTGLLGVAVQKWVPAALAEGLRVEALLSRIPELIQKNLEEADGRVAEAGDVLERFYRTELRPGLRQLAPSWSYLLDVRSGRERALERFRRIAPFVDEEERQTLEDLESLFIEKLELDAHFSLQRLLRGWLALHVPAAGILLGLIAVHAATWVLY